jgi:hypothetical protein
MSEYYSYMYLRIDGTPYYVGKGKGRRAFRIHRANNIPRFAPPSEERIVIYPAESEADAFETEVALIWYYGRKDLGTGCLRNLTDGGEGPSGHIKSAENRKRISARMLGRTVSEETGRKISEAKKGKVIVSAEQRLAIAKALIGRTWSKEERKAHSTYKKDFCLRGHARTPENLSGSNCKVCLREKNKERRIKAGLPVGRCKPPNWKGKKRSEHHRQAMRLAAKNRAPMSIETKAKIAAAKEGKKPSEETSKKMSLAHIAIDNVGCFKKGFTPWNKGISKPWTKARREAQNRKQT